MGTETTKYRIILDDRLSPAMRKALKTANAFDNKMVAIDKHAKKTGKSLSRAFSGFALKAGIIAGAVLATKAIVKLGAEMEMTRLSYQTLLGDAAQGNKLMSDLIQLAAVTPLRTEQVLQASKQLLSFGFAANEVEETIRQLGDVSTATGADLTLMTRNLAQVKSMGKLLSRDLYTFTNSGFNPLNEIAKRTGESMEELQVRMQKGLITFAEVKQAFKDVTGEGGRFENMMDKSSKTLTGRWSTLMSNISLQAATMGESVTTDLGNAVLALNNFVVEQAGSMMKSFTVITDGIGNIFGSITRLMKKVTGEGSGADAWATALEGVAFAFGVIANAITFVIDSLTSLGLGLVGFFQVAAGGLKQFMRKSPEAKEEGRLMKERGLANMSEAGAGLATALSDLGTNMVKTLVDSLKPVVKAEEDNTVLSGKGGSGKLGLGGEGGAGAKGGTVSGMQSKVRNITINIENMVREIVFQSNSVQGSQAELTDMVKQALLTAVNDVNIISR